MRAWWPIALLLTACGSPAGAPTWHQDIAPLVAARCQSCHAPGTIAPFDLVTYADASSIAGWIAQTVEAGTMPPFGAQDTDECTPPLPWKDDARLSEAEIALFRAWADAGAPEGDPATAAPLPAPRGTGLARVDQELLPDGAWTTEVGRDQFRCFVLDPELDATRFLVGAQVQPDNDDVVHHVLVFSTDPDAAGEARALAAGDPSGSFPCSGEDPLPVTGGLVAAWAPGALPMQTPQGTGMPMAAGTLLVMQIHYHPVPGARPDRTSLQLQWEDESPGRPALMVLVGNEGSAPELQPSAADPESGPRFFIPAGARNHQEVIRYESLQQDVPEVLVWAAGTHMHYAGTDMKITHWDAEGNEKCLVQTPAWDFNWQRWYSYDAPLSELPRVRAGDTLELRCTYDNSLQNEAVAQALKEQGHDAPVDITLGEQTLDEMCLAVFGITLP